MSESEYESFVGWVTTFHAPSLFWFIYEQDIASRNSFNDKLNKPSVTYPRIEEVSVGQKVIIQYGEEWVRAEIANIKKEDNKKEYICWLLDYGIFGVTTSVCKLPDRAKLVPPFVHKAMLYGLQSIILNFDFGASALQEHRETEWVPGIRRCVTDILKTPKIIQTFRKRFQFEDYLIGEIFIQHPEEGIFDLGEKIIAKGLAKYDEASFMASLQLIKMVEKSLSIVYMQTRYFIERDLSKILENQKRCMGRGTFRSVDAYIKDTRKKSKDFSTSVFDDAENDEGLPRKDKKLQGKSSRPKEDQEQMLQEPVTSKGRGKKFADMLASKRQDNISGNESETSKTDSNSFDNKSDGSSPTGRGFRKDFGDKPEINKTKKEEVGLNSAMKDLNIYTGRGRFRKSTESSESTKENDQTINDIDDAKFEDAENKTESVILKNVYPAGVHNRALKNPSYITYEKNTASGVENICEKMFETKSSGRGFKKSSDISISSSSENESKSVSRGRGFKSHQDLSSSSETENACSQVKPKGRGIELSDSESETFSGSDDFKSFGRGFKRHVSFNTNDTSTESESINSAVFREATVDCLNFRAAGSNLNQNFQCGVNQKRPPIEQTTSNKTVIESVKEFIDTFKTEENASAPKHKKIPGLCDCLVCAEWINNNKVFEPVVTEPPKSKVQKVVIKPPLLFKTDDQQEIQFKIHTERIFENDTEKLAAPRLLVHGYLRAEPASDLPHIPFDEKVQMGLRQMNYSNAYSIQTYAWPAVLRGHSVILVSVPECGKTMVYVPTLCNFTFNKNPFLPEENGPISIILCPRVKVVEAVYRLFSNVIRKLHSEVKVMSVTHLYEKRTIVQLRRGVDILITTPRYLIKMLKQDVFNLSRLCHLVLEEAQDLLSMFPLEIDYIFKKTQRVLEKRTDYIPIQLITISQEWSKRIEDLAKKFRIPPLICIGAHLEAAFYGNAEIKIQIVKSHEKSAKLIEIIKDKSKVRKTVIICNDDDNAAELLNYLDTHGIPFESLLITAAIEDINAIKKRWYNSTMGNYFVMVCSDNIFNTGLAITDAEVMVQYSLPENWSQFTFRFSGFLDSYSCPLAVKREDMPRCLMHIIIDDTNVKQFPRMLQFLQRMGNKLTNSLMNYYYELTAKMEQERLENKIKLCEEMLCNGSCRNVITCKFRHMLCPKEDTSPTLPQSGLVKLKILYTLSPVQHYARLLSYTDSNNVSHDFTDYLGLIATQLLSLKQENKKVPVIKLRIGILCAVEETEEASKGNFQRCKILDIIKANNHYKKVLVRLIDTGREQHVLSTHIYYLPDHLKKIPPVAVPIYISNIGPPDKDLTWPNRCSVLLRREFTTAGFSQDNCFFTGRIKLQLNNGLFVDDLKLQEELDDGALVVHKLSIRDTLLKIKALEERPKHLEKLYERCNTYQIPLADYSLPVIKIVKKIEPQVKPTWAHLENMEEFNKVYFCIAHNPDSFFIRLSKNDSCLEQLKKDIEEAMNKPFYRGIASAMEGRCYLVKDETEQIYARAIVKKLMENTAECFFVDYGDTTEVKINDLKYIPDDLITQLPFQAIECKLHGIQPLGMDQNWLNEAIDIFYDIAHEPNTDILRCLHVKVIDKEKAQFTGYKKYSVVLLDTFEQDTIINNVLLDLGYAIQVAEKRIEVDFDKIHLENCETENVDSSDDDVAQYESNLATVPENEEFQTNINSEDYDDNSMAFFVYDIEEFQRELFSRRDSGNTPNISEVDINSQEFGTSSQEFGKNLKALPMPSPGFSTPKIVWQQTNTQITLRIQIPSVTEYEVKVLRGRMLSFKTTCQEIDYRVDLNLYGKIHSNVEHTNFGLDVLVKMKKIVEEEWPRLVISKEKQRYITYNAAVIHLDDDSDDEKPLSKEKIQRSKNFGEELERQIENGPFIHNCGSDTDWSVSDVESERDSDAS